MTLFDSIRYPISVPVRLEELEALPVSLYTTWARTLMGPGYNDSPTMFIMVAVATEVALQSLKVEPDPEMAMRGKKSVELLRQMILDWDGDEHIQ